MFPKPIQQRQAQRFLELLDLVGNGRLAESQLLRREAEALQVRDRHASYQLTQRQRAVEVESRAVLGHGAYDICAMAARRPKSLTPVRRTTPTIEGVEAPHRAPTTVSEQKLNQYRKRRYQALHAETEAANKRRAAGKATARDRIEMLLDDGSFVELDVFAVHRGHGFGVEDGRVAGR